jgi:hypothetical protein
VSAGAQVMPRTMGIPLMVGRGCAFFSTDELIGESSFHEIHVTLSCVDPFRSTLDSLGSFIGISSVLVKKRSVSLLILSDSLINVIDEGFEQLDIISEWNCSGESTEDFFEGEES